MGVADREKGGSAVATEEEIGSSCKLWKENQDDSL